jgi:hypothetical protein
MRLSVCCILAGGLAVQACGGNSTNDSPAARAPVSLPERCEPELGPDGRLFVDGFEDDDELLDESANLHGVWYVENDGSGEQSPPAAARATGALLDSPGAPGSTAHALHTSGGGFERWGAFVGVKLNASRSAPCVYDLSAYSRLTLSAKGAGSVRVNIGTVSTTPVEDYGECDSDTCSDYGATLDLDGDWREAHIGLDRLTQPDWATPAAWEPARALRLSFFWAAHQDFDLWLDDLVFD